MLKINKKYIPILVYVILLSILEIIFWFNKNECGLGFGVISYYILIPLTIIVISIIYGRNIISKKKYLLSIGLGFLVMLFEYTTYSLANMLAFNKINLPSISTWIIYTVISILGMFIGKIFKK